MRTPTAALVLFAAVSLSLLLSGFCAIAVGGVMVAEGAMYGAVMRPYDRTLSQGRIGPVEYRQQMAEVDRGMDALFCPPSAGKWTPSIGQTSTKK